MLKENMRKRIVIKIDMITQLCSQIKSLP